AWTDSIADTAEARLPGLASVAAGWAVPGVWANPDAAAQLPSVELGPLVQQLVDTTALLEAVIATELPAGQAIAEAEALLAAGQRLRVQLLSRITDVQARGLCELRGFRSVTAWLRETQPDADTADVTMAKRLPDQPVLQAAVHTAVVSLRAGRQVQTALTRCRPYVDRPDGLIDGQPGEPVIGAVVGNVLDLVCRQQAGLAEDAPLALELDERVRAIVSDGGSQLHRLERSFVLLAEKLPAGEVLEAALDEQVYALVPNLLEQAQAKAEAKRVFRVTPTPTGWRVSGELTPECGERLLTGLAAEARRDSLNPHDTASWEQLRARAQSEGRDVLDVLVEHEALAGPDPDPWTTPHPDFFSSPDGDTASSPDTVGPSHDASSSGDETGGLGSDLPRRRPRARGERLHDALNNLLGRYLSDGMGGTHDKVPVQVIATLTAGTIDGRPGALPGKGGSGHPLARSLLRRWWCDAHVTALLMSRHGKPLGIAHTGRTLTGLERKAAHVQFDQRCMGIGCCRGRPDPLTLLVPHHVRKYADDGLTVLEESLLFCETAHHDVHTGKKTIRLRDGRLVNEQGWVVTADDQA
ncbi:MAG: 13E12 repeat family protein, partial [Actinomycetota bacterium]|nr:13E12 repeat family protein [Actinomycetota bacterium]